MIKQRLTSQKAYITYFVIAVLLIGVVVFRYLDTFASVNFQYDSSMGSISLHSDGEKLHTPANNESVRLKKGSYIVKSSGKNIDTNTQEITVDGSKDTYDINFRYTDKYLASLYEDEQLSIYTAMLLEYPSILSDYTLHNDQLYGLGDWFGAALVYNDQEADNRDTLHILMKKSGDNWQVISTPPSPVLSAPDYPQVPYSILMAINQAK